MNIMISNLKKHYMNISLNRFPSQFRVSCFDLAQGTLIYFCGKKENACWRGDTYKARGTTTVDDTGLNSRDYTFRLASFMPTDGITCVISLFYISISPAVSSNNGVRIRVTWREHEKWTTDLSLDHLSISKNKQFSNRQKIWRWGLTLKGSNTLSHRINCLDAWNAILLSE